MLMKKVLHRGVRRTCCLHEPSGRIPSQRDVSCLPYYHNPVANGIWKGRAVMQSALRDLTGSYDLPCTIAALLLFGASLASFSIQEKRYSMRYQAASSAATD
jgi:hypothetical protein